MPLPFVTRFWVPVLRAPDAPESNQTQRDTTCRIHGAHCRDFFGLEFVSAIDAAFSRSIAFRYGAQ